MAYLEFICIIETNLQWIHTILTPLQVSRQKCAIPQYKSLTPSDVIYITRNVIYQRAPQQFYADTVSARASYIAQDFRTLAKTAFQNNRKSTSRKPVYEYDQQKVLMCKLKANLTKNFTHA